MYYIGVCILQGFYVGQLQKRGDFSQPLVVTAQKSVLDACPLAKAKGVLPGSALSVAKAILGPQACWVAWKEEDYASGQHEWLHLCEKYTDAIEPINQHSAYLDLSAHAQPDDIAEIFTEDLTRHGFSAKMGVGGNKWTAELVALHGDPGQIALIMPRRYVGSFPVSLLPLEAGPIQKLTLLGCHHIADILAIPAPALRAQFGDEAIRLRKWALGGDDPIVKAIFPRDKLSAVFWPSGPVEDTIALNHCLEVLASRLGEKLESQDKFGHTIDLILERDAPGPLTSTRTFSKPVFDAITVLGALRLMTSALHEPILALRAQIPDLKAKDRHQPGLIGPHDASAKQQKAAEAMQRVKQLYGQDAVRPTSALTTPRQIFLRAFDDDPKS